MRKIFLFAAIAGLFVFSACKKATEDFTTVPLEDYSPLVVGKYITYKLDSLRYINFGVKDTVISYEVKHYIDAQVNDGLGRPGYRIIRYIRKTAIDPWNADNTFFAIPVNNSIEFIENNLRFIKLKNPVRNDFSWKGNSYIEAYSLPSDLKYLADWDYTYDSVNVATQVGAITVDSALKVKQADFVFGNPADKTAYSEINFSEEKYGKGIGLIYRKFLHAEYQPPATVGSSGKYSDGSYGITLTMIDHN